MSKLIEGLIQFANLYFSKNAVPESVKILGKSFEIVLGYTNPNTNSKKRIQYLYTPNNIQAGSYYNNIPNLIYLEKPNRIEISNSFQSVLVSEKHQNILQDDIFGFPKVTKNKTKWVYIAKVKEQKSKSFYQSGTGLAEFSFDYGQKYTGTTKSAIFILDTEKSTITKIPIDENIIACNPQFLDDQGKNIIFHGFKKELFGYGILHCFNRQVSLYHARLTQQNYEIIKIPTKFKTNMFAKISPCKNFLLYICGEGSTHSYSMHINIVKKNQISGQWQDYYILENFFYGSYQTCKSEIYQAEGKSFALVQTYHQGFLKIFQIDILNKSYQQLSNNSVGQSVSLMLFDKTQNLLFTKSSNINEIALHYAFLPGPLKKIQPLFTVPEFKIEQFKQPIPYFLLKSEKKSQILEKYLEKKQKSPLVVLIHGGPHGNGDCSLSFYKYLLLQAGYTILIPNFSGSIGYDSKHLQNALGKIGELDAEQILTCVKNVLKNEQIDPKRVYLYGGSYGGYMSAILAGRHSQFFAAAALLNPVLSLPFMVSTTDIPEWCTIESLNKNTIADLTPQQYSKLYKDSPISTPSKIPTLLIVGQKDRRVPYEAAKMYHALTRMKGTNIKTYIYPESDHSLSDSIQTSIDIIFKSFLFFQQHARKQ